MRTATAKEALAAVYPAFVAESTARLRAIYARRRAEGPPPIWEDK